MSRDNLPEIPADIIECFKREVGPPPAGVALTQEMVADLIGELVVSDHVKSLCGLRLVEWYNTLRNEKAP